jgi:F-type H+-transporting ATPase subunit epsilon
MEKIFVEIIQPKRILVSGEYDQIIIPGVEGDFGVLANHTPFITKLRPGILELISNDNSEEFAIHNGYVNIQNNQVKIVCETIEKREEIDINRAKQAKERAEMRMKSNEENIDFRRAELALKRALVRLNLHV